MKDYGNSIVPYTTTGFPSACTEYAEKRLSLDERHDTFNPAMVSLILNQDHPLFSLRKGDELQIKLGERPQHNDIVYTSFMGEEGIFRFQRINQVGSLFPPTYTRDQLDDVISGVVVSLHRSLIELRN